MTKTPDYFAGKTIIITGAGSGIGRATALIFAREHANVVCADINEKSARDTADAVNGKGSQALALKVDVTSRAQVDDMVKRSIDAFGSVQFLFNSAGAAIRRAKFLEIDDALLEKTFALNVNGTLYGMQAVLPQMLKNQFGVIVNVASMAHRRGGPGYSIHYAAAKGAVVSMTLGVARELFLKGLPLAGRVDRRLAIDLELFSRGGLKILEKIEQQDYNVLRSRPRISKVERAGLLLGALTRRALTSVANPAA